jgi:hypothetical protein
VGDGWGAGREGSGCGNDVVVIGSPVHRARMFTGGLLTCMQLRRQAGCWRLAFCCMSVERSLCVAIMPIPVCVLCWDRGMDAGSLYSLTSDQSTSEPLKCFV